MSRGGMGGLEEGRERRRGEEEERRGVGGEERGGEVMMVELRKGMEWERGRGEGMRR